MRARGAYILSFFGAVFAALTLATQRGWTGAWLAPPFAVTVLLSFAAWRTARATGGSVPLARRAGRVILWSSVAEGVGLFVAGNVVVNLHRPELLIPAMALVVGLHFIPMALGMPFRPYLPLAAALLLAALAGFLVHAPVGPELAGFGAALALWLAALLALRRQVEQKPATAGA